MATVPRSTIVSGSVTPDEIEYPSGDGQPMAETPVHFDNLTNLVKTLQRWFSGDSMTYVAGNMFVYYARGDVNKSVAPDVYVVRGVPRDKDRGTYNVWEEDGHAPDLVIELTSRWTSDVDTGDKFYRYQDELRVRELFLFDPLDQYLKPRFRGYRLWDEQYVPIEPVANRLPSEVTSLHFEAHGRELRLYDPKARCWLPWADEGWDAAESARMAAESARMAAEAERNRLAAALANVDEERRKQELEIDRLHRELESWRRSPPPS
ncbi:MAG TPA: Uma2 family endonuclease [Pirellulales bacterium]|nr:Uma2 family endonuclease [Pirellulales bacterium]